MVEQTGRVTHYADTVDRCGGNHKLKTFRHNHNRPMTNFIAISFVFDDTFSFFYFAFHMPFYYFLSISLLVNYRITNNYNLD